MFTSFGRMRVFMITKETLRLLIKKNQRITSHREYNGDLIAVITKAIKRKFTVNIMKVQWAR